MLLLVALACAPEAVEPLCPSYSGITAVGRAWSWRRFSDGTETEASVTELSEAGVTLSGNDWEEHYTCDTDGLWAVSRDTFADDFSALWEYDPPWLVMPATLSVGDAWTSNAAWRYTDSVGLRETASRNEQVEVVNQGESNVSAGAFSTLELQRLDDHGASRTEYRAAAVGLVLDDDAQLVTISTE